VELTKTITELQSASFEQLTAAQSKIVDVNRQMAERLAGVADKLPPVPFANEAASFNREFVDSVFDWSAKLIEANRRFAADLMGVWGVAPEKPEAAAKASATK